MIKLPEPPLEGVTKLDLGRIQPPVKPGNAPILLPCTHEFHQQELLRAFENEMRTDDVEKSFRAVRIPGKFVGDSIVGPIVALHSSQ